MTLPLSSARCRIWELQGRAQGNQWPLRKAAFPICDMEMTKRRPPSISEQRRDVHFSAVDVFSTCLFKSRKTSGSTTFLEAISRVFFRFAQPYFGFSNFKELHFIWGKKKTFSWQILGFVNREELWICLIPHSRVRGGQQRCKFFSAGRERLPSAAAGQRERPVLELCSINRGIKSNCQDCITRYFS